MKILDRPQNFVMDSEFGQAYLSLRWNNEGEILPIPTTREWNVAQGKMMKALPRKSSKMIRGLALGLAKYDFYQDPENWEDDGHGECRSKFILEAVEYAMKNRESYSSDIQNICKSYRRGKIPDGFYIICDYCT